MNADAFSHLFAPRRALLRALRSISLLALAAAAVIAAEPPRIGLAESVRSTLRRDPNIQIQEEQVKFSRGTILREAGVFDFTLDTATSQGVIRTPRSELDRLSIVGKTNISETVADVSNQRLAVSKQFRGGPSVSTGVEFTRVSNNLDDGAANRANVNFIINVPLLKRFGTTSSGANEQAAKVLGEAAILELGFIAGQRVLNVAAAFWECLGAEENVRTLRASADRATNLLNHVSQLVGAGEIPRAELRQTEADVAQKQAELKGGEQRFVQARQNFGLALGLEGKELENAPLPESLWPAVQTNGALPMFTGQPMIDRSLIRRGDYQAARKGGEAAALLEKAARHDLLPQLDLNLELGYAGLSEGNQFQRFYTSIDPRAVGGPNAIGTVRFVYPLGNHSAKGLVMQREAQKSQAALREQNLARGIGSAIMVAFSDLEQSSLEVTRAREAVALYRQTVENEREKLRIGASTIVDVITIADRLDAAEIRATDALVRYATALARIRYETGLLPSTAAREGAISIEDLRTMPVQSEFESAPKQSTK